MTRTVTLKAACLAAATSIMLATPAWAEQSSSSSEGSSSDSSSSSSPSSTAAHYKEDEFRRAVEVLTFGEVTAQQVADCPKLPFAHEGTTLDLVQPLPEPYLCPSEPATAADVVEALRVARGNKLVFFQAMQDAKHSKLEHYAPHDKFRFIGYLPAVFGLPGGSS